MLFSWLNSDVGPLCRCNGNDDEEGCTTFTCVYSHKATAPRVQQESVVTEIMKESQKLQKTQEKEEIGNEELERQRETTMAEALQAQEVIADQAERQQYMRIQVRLEKRQLPRQGTGAKRTKSKDSERSRRRLSEFLANSGFKDVEQRKSKAGWFSFSYHYPLHAAVEANDSGLVQALLRKVNKTDVRDSNGLTPKELAIKLDKDGSHTAVINALKRC